MQSYPTLQADPNDTVISILTHIATRLDNLDDTSLPSLQPTIPSPVSASLAVTNAFWFVSLVLSISTALVGIVSLQWIREHQKYPQSLSPRERFAIYNMRAEGLNKWYIPQILSSLPVLLQLSLILFLAGLVVFITQFKLYISCPVIVAISFPLIFLILTSTLPAMQGILLCLPILGKSLTIPVQCPYKSPQSEAVRYLISAYAMVFSLLVCLLTLTHTIYEGFAILFVNVFKGKGPNRRLEGRRRSKSDKVHEKQEREDSRHTIIATWNKRDWLDFDKEWLLIRDAYAKSLYQDNTWICSAGAFQYSRLTGPLYDLASGLRYLAVKNPQSSIQETAYGCVQELGEGLLNFQRPEYQYYLQSVLATGLSDNSFASFSRLVKFDLISPQLLTDEIAFIFLSSCRSPPPMLVHHFKKLHAQLVRHLFLNHDYRPSAAVGGQDIPKYADQRLSIVYSKTRAAVKSSKNSAGAVLAGSDGTFCQPSLPYSYLLLLSEITETMSSFIEDFFHNITNKAIDDDKFFSSFAASHFTFSPILQFVMGQQSADAIQNTIAHLTQHLSYRDSKKEANKRSDFLFYAAAFYARSLLLPDDLLFSLQKTSNLQPAMGQNTQEEKVKWRDDVPVIIDFLPVLRLYLKERGKSLIDLQLVPPRSDKWWDFLEVKKKERSSRNPIDATSLAFKEIDNNEEKEIRAVRSSTSSEREDDKQLDVV